MIIRSQDKKQIVNFDVCHLSITTDHCIVATNGVVSYPSEILSGVIGKYSTEEKAIKVLDIICNTYVETVWTDSQMIIANRVCFEMPSDEEVEVQHEKEN